jgi:predicted transcriptional regulator
MNLKVARAVRELRQWDVAIRCGICQTRISLIEAGLVCPREDEKKRIAKALDLRAEKIDWGNNCEGR